jgi:hypothetical protein
MAIGGIMNDRQKALVDLLKFYSTGGVKLSRNQIQQHLPKLYERTAESDYNDNGLHLITKDIHDINNGDNDILIISTPSGIRLATHQEVYDALQKERIAIIKRLVLLQRKLDKARKHDQLSYDANFSIYRKVTLQ